jgi:hypothetical protein
MLGNSNKPKKSATLPNVDDQAGIQRTRRITREKILTAYRAGPEAIASLIEYLQDMYESELRGLRADYAVLAEELKELKERLHTDSHFPG